MRYKTFEVQNQQDSFGDQEVGLSHPVLPSFVKLADNGAIEIFAKEGLGIVIDPNTNRITFVAETVNMITKEQHGLRWNKVSFNPQALNFTEPALVPYDDHNEIKSLYSGVSQYLEEG